MSSHVVLVTGAGGFIGSAITSALHERGVVVHALVGDHGHKIIEPPIGVRAERADICDLSTMRRLTNGVGTLVHAAGPPSVAESFKNAVEYARIHVEGTVTVLQACLSSGVRRFIYISSAEVYGQPKTEVAQEDGNLAPRSPYGAAKASAEHFVQSFRRGFGIECVILRPFSVYGPRLSSQSLIGRIAHQAVTADRVVVNDLRPVRDYCYVDDVARAVLCACYSPISEAHVFNVGTGIGVSVAELARMVLSIRSREIPIVENIGHDRPEGSEILCLVADTKRAREVLGWEARYELKKGLEKTIQSLALT